MHIDFICPFLWPSISDLFPDTTVTCTIAAHGSITAAEYNGNALTVSGITTDWSAENRVTFETTRYPHSYLTVFCKGRRAWGAWVPPIPGTKKTRVLSKKDCIKVCIIYAWWRPGTSAPSKAHLTVSLCLLGALEWRHYLFKKLIKCPRRTQGGC